MIKRNLIFVVLATFCLTAILFTVIPVGSYGTYDPWLDSPSEDGKIDVRDVAPVAAAYGSTGNPTKNVSVTNWPVDENGNLKTVDYMPSGVFNASLEIVVQSTSVVGTPDRGIAIFGNDEIATEMFAFAFEPKSQNFSVSELCLQLVYYSGSVPGMSADVYLNGVYLETKNFRPGCCCIVILMQDQARCASLHRGINILKIAPGGTFQLQELKLLVGYQFST
jgi:hypothetical protein